MTETWNFPTHIRFGEGAIDELGAILTPLGVKRVLLVTDQGVVEAGLVEAVGKVLRGAKIAYHTWSELSSNPKESEVQAGLESYLEHGAEAVVALGGGSAMDVGKLVRLLATHEGPLSRYEEQRGGASLISSRMPPMIAVPTTAGTGSEVGRSGVVTLAETGQKATVFSPFLMPTAAILDPALTVSLPASVTAATGFDALTHCVEAYCAVGHHPMADAIARQGIELVAKHLETAVTDGTSIEARANMMTAATMGAVAFQKGLGACHGLAHPLSTECGLHHGLANALCLPSVLDFNRSVVPARVARVARLLGVKGDDLETLAFECGGAVRAFRERLGLAKSLSELGVDEAQLPALAALAFADPVHKTNPRPCTKDDMLALYRASY